MLRVSFLQSLKQLIENRLILLVVLLYIAGSDHLHDHGEVLLIGRSLIMEIADKGLEQHRCRLIPERVLCLRTFGRCVFEEVGGQPLNIIIAADIHEWVVAMTFLHINEVKDFDLIALLLQQMAGIPEKLTLWVKHNERSIRIHNVGLGVEACFTCTGTAAYQHIQVSAVLSSVQTNGDILRQQLVFRLILVGIFLVDRTSRAPLGRSVLFSPSVIVLRGEIDADGDPVHQKQSEDSFYTVLTKLYLEWVLHHRSELLNQSGQSIL